MYIYIYVYTRVCVFTEGMPETTGLLPRKLYGTRVAATLTELRYLDTNGLARDYMYEYFSVVSVSKRRRKTILYIFPGTWSNNWVLSLQQFSQVTSCFRPVSHQIPPSLNGMK